MPKKVSARNLPESLTKDPQVIKAMKSIQSAGLWALLIAIFCPIILLIRAASGSMLGSTVVILLLAAFYLGYSGLKMNRLEGGKSITVMLVVNTVIGLLLVTGIFPLLMIITSIVALTRVGTFRKWQAAGDKTISKSQLSVKESPRIPSEPKSSSTSDTDKITKMIVDRSRRLAQEIKISNDEKLTNQNHLSLMIYCVSLNYVLVDRMAYTKFSSDDRDTFSDGLMEAIANTVSTGTGIKREDVIDTINKNVQRLAPYSSKLFPDKDESMKGTLFWEFGKVITDDLGLDQKIVMTGSLLAAQNGVEVMDAAKPLLK